MGGSSAGSAPTSQPVGNPTSAQAPTPTQNNLIPLPRPQPAFAPTQPAAPQYTVDAWGRSMPAQTGFTPGGFSGYQGGPQGGYHGRKLYGSNVVTGNTYSGDRSPANNVTTYAGDSRQARQDNTPTRFNGAPISESNPGMIPWEYDSMNNPFAVHDPKSYDRKSAGLPGFIPGAGFINAALGSNVPDTPERAAERAYNQANPGQSNSLGNRYLGTGKWEPFHPTDVKHTQEYGDNRKGYGETNESGIGRDTNYDRFGNMRTEIPTGIDPGSAYWNSTTKAWTDKKTGVPLGGSISNHNSTPDVAKQSKITAAEIARLNKIADEETVKDNRDKKSEGTKAIEAQTRAQLSKQQKFISDNKATTAGAASDYGNNTGDYASKRKKSSSSSSSSNKSSGTHCCTAAFSQGMPIHKIKELRKWHRDRSALWQEGYDVYGKFIADNLVSGSKFWSDVTEAGHTIFVEKKVTPMSILALLTIAPGSLATGLFLKLTKSKKETTHVLSK